MNPASTCPDCDAALTAEGHCPRCQLHLGLQGVAAEIAPDVPLLAPDSMPGYEIQALIGRGGMGILLAVSQPEVPDQSPSE